MTTSRLNVHEPVAMPAIDVDLQKLQQETFGYFLHETNPANGLVDSQYDSLSAI